MEDAFAFIDELKKGDAPDTPFFMWLSFAEPHSPYQVPEPYFDLFPPEELPALDTGAADLAAKGPRYQRLRECWEEVLGGAVDARIPRVRSNYHGMLRLLDDQLKRLMKGLQERKLDKDTLVIYLSDHGDFVGEYGLIKKGSNPCDFYVLDQYCLGNMNCHSMKEIEDKRKKSGFMERSFFHAEKCRECKWFSLCRGGCFRSRIETGQDREGINYFCRSYQMFFETCFERLRQVAVEIYEAGNK